MGVACSYSLAPEAQYSSVTFRIVQRLPEAPCICLRFDLGELCHPIANRIIKINTIIIITIIIIFFDVDVGILSRIGYDEHGFFSHCMCYHSFFRPCQLLEITLVGP